MTMASALRQGITGQILAQWRCPVAAVSVNALGIAPARQYGLQNGP